MPNTLKNITGTTAVVLGLALATNGSIIITDNNYTTKNYKIYAEAPQYNQSNIYSEYSSNVYIENRDSRLDHIASETFGVMRDATKEETEGVNRYIESISYETGIDFFSLC